MGETIFSVAQIAFEMSEAEKSMSFNKNLSTILKRTKWVKVKLSLDQDLLKVMENATLIKPHLPLRNNQNIVITFFHMLQKNNRNL